MSTVKQSANFIVESVCPPEMHNVLWMDVAIPGNPILKVWQKGKWIPTFTDQSKAVNLMAHSIYDLTQECVSVVKESAKQGPNPLATNTAIYDKLEHIDFSEITEGIEDIKEEVSEIQYDIEHIDFTSLAKQGSDSQVSLTSINSKIGNPSISQATTLFGAIGQVASSIDFEPVEEAIDDVKYTVTVPETIGVIGTTLTFDGFEKIDDAYYSRWLGENDLTLYVEGEVAVGSQAYAKSGSTLVTSGTVTQVSGYAIAKESTLGDVKSALEYMQSGGMPQIATIAKQGTNASATLTATQAAVVDGNDTAISVGKDVRSEVGSGSDTAAETGTLFAVVKWVKDKVKSIFNLIGSPASGQPTNLFAAIAAGGGASVQDIVNGILAAVNVPISYSGVVVSSPLTISSIGDILLNLENITEIIDNNIVSIGITLGFKGLRADSLGSNTFRGLISLIKFEARSAVYVPQNFAEGSVSVQYIDIRSARTISYRSFYGCTNLKYLNIHDCNTIVKSGDEFFHCYNLIDIIYGAGVSASTSYLNTWNPTNALSSSSTSLVDEGETFSSNLEKLLYNIRNHIAANLPDRTGLSALTITFHADVKAAIQADTATAQAFSNKNWTIA